MFAPVSSRVNLPELEEQMMQFWQQNDIFRRSVDERPADRPYTFYEGPPTANGRPGIHHVLARVFKDAFPRYWTMKGYRVPRKGGWDTHGLPVEIEVERQLGLKSKPEIEAYGVEEFNKRCKTSVFTYVQDWEKLTERIGFWVDMQDAYVTYANDYIETGWWIFKSLWEKDLVFQDYRSTPHCPRCGTSLSSHELALGYKEDTPDPSVFIKFPVSGAGPSGGLDAAPARGTGPAAALPDLLRSELPTYFLAWTTTPWTLPGNTALAVAADAEYSVVELEQDDILQRIIMAAALKDKVLGEEAQMVGTLRGSELVGLRYVPLYEPAGWGVDVSGFVDGRLRRFGTPEEAPTRRVVATDFVSMDDGTGIVHIAPAFGGEDYETGRREGLRFILHVDLKGEIMGQSPFSGEFVKDADKRITRDLRDRGLLWRAETYRHTYPFCWRCDTPLLYIAKPSWYIRTTAFKDRLLANNDRINWYPEHIRTGRFGDWLENNIDWAVSRERYWGTPLPIWQCQGCAAFQCVGSVAEMVERAVEPERARALTDLHRPYVDDILLRCASCGGMAKRVPEVADAWFDSGAMPYAQWHYPFENKEAFEQGFPADFICEAIDQTRGWFYTLHAEATLLNAVEEVPSGISFKNCVVLGHILDKNGEKMSKSRGNVVDPWDMLNQYGADPLRWYLYSASPFGQPRRFNPEHVGETLRRFFLTLWNTYSFFVTYANIDGWTPEQLDPNFMPEHELDRWVLSELNLTVRQVSTAMDGYNATDASRRIDSFVDDLSNWYVRRSRRRFWKSEADTDKRNAYQTLYTCLTTVTRLMAPLAPFTAEALWQNLGRAGTNAVDSVHLAEWPAVNDALIDEQLSDEVRLVMRLVSLGRSARARAKVKVRQPLAEVIVQGRTREENDATERLAPQIQEELNVKAVQVARPGDAGLVEYDIKLNLPVVARRLGAARPAVQTALQAMDTTAIALAVQEGRSVVVDGHELAPTDLLVSAKDRPGYVVVQEAGYTVALATEVSADLADEGFARELVHRLQTMRKDAGFDIADRIFTSITGDGDLGRILLRHAGYIAGETLSVEVNMGPPPPGAFTEEQEVEGQRLRLSVVRA